MAPFSRLARAGWEEDVELPHWALRPPEGTWSHGDRDLEVAAYNTYSTARGGGGGGGERILEAHQYYRQKVDREGKIRKIEENLEKTGTKAGEGFKRTAVSRVKKVPVR